MTDPVRDPVGEAMARVANVDREGWLQVVVPLDGAYELNITTADLRLLLSALSEARERFRKYGEHDEGCRWWVTKHPCDCGFDEAWYTTFPQDRPHAARTGDKG